MRLYLSLGSNIGAREDFLEKALRALEENVGKLLKCSSFYETAPEGFASEHRFLNAAAEFETSLPPRDILRITQETERALGRREKSRDGIYRDRTIDIDILLLDDLCMEEEGLSLPHPRLAERQFVLAPLAEIAPRLRHPQTGRSVGGMLAEVKQPGIRRLTEADEAATAAVNRLLAQLSQRARPLTPAALQAVIDSPQTLVYVMKDDAGAIRAMATLCLCPLPTGTKAWVEDVVVDSGARGRGYARQLLAHLKREAARQGARSLNLTSKPEREAANRLYQSEGFVRRETNVYKLDCGK